MIDIIMATYNGEKYVAEQLDSILNQTFTAIRILIRDDGSTDDTIKVLERYEKEYPEKIIIIRDNKHCGSPKSNFMTAMSYSDAPYIMFADQDDYWLSEKIQHTYDAMLREENRIGKEKPILVFGSYRPVDSELKDYKDKKHNRQEAAYKLHFSNLLVQNYVHGCLMMINRKLAELMGEYNEDILMHDWWAALIAAGCGRIVHVDEVMMLYRQHNNNVVGSVDVRSPSYVLKKILDKTTKDACKKYYKQAHLLNEQCGDYFYEITKLQLDGFLELYSHKKIIRIISLIKGNYLKSDWIRILGQLVLI